MSMFHPGREQFIEQASKYNLIAVYRDVVADLETPVSAFKKLGDGPNSFLLESVEGGEKLGRYSVLGISALATFKSRNHEITIEFASGRRESFSDSMPIDRLRDLMRLFEAAPDPNLPTFWGGAVGYVSYEEIRNIEPAVGKQQKTELPLPHMQFSIPDTLLIFDHVRHRLKIVGIVFLDGRMTPGEAYDDATRRVNTVHQRLMRSTSQGEHTVSASELVTHSNMSPELFTEMVNKGKEFIQAGDAFQIVLSQRFQVELGSDPFDVYRNLRVVNPSPYMFFMKLEGGILAGSSPETLCRVDEERIASIRPIAGTRWRGKTYDEDQRLGEELLADPKECAEHIMLVDLARNDLGRVCNNGSVWVDELMVVERYSHVMHIVSNVKGKLREDCDAFDAFKSAFPHGTVTGAPKIRAMQIIDELEPTARGPYAGAVGYFGFQGTLDCCITLRTILMVGDQAYVQAGAGIVADSDPAAEYQETINKASAMIKAIEMAEMGLD